MTGLIIVALYLVVVLGIGVYAYRSNVRFAGTEEYLLAGRSLGWFLALFALLATQYSALTVQGFPANMYTFGLPGFIAIVGFAVFIYPMLWSFWAPRIWKLGRLHGQITPGDILEDYFSSRGPRYVISAVMFIAIIPYLQVQIIGAGFLFNVATGGLISVQGGGIILYVVAILYTILGGMRGLAMTDTIQGVMLSVGVAATAFAVIFAIGDGSVAGIFQTVGADHSEYLTVPGAAGPWQWPFLITWMISLGLGIPSHAHMWLRIHISRDLRVVRAFPLILVLSFPLIMVMGFIIAAGAIPVLEPGSVSPDSMVPVMAERFGGPAVLLMVAAAGIAAMMSSLDGQAHALGALVTRDWIQPLRGVPDPKQQGRITRFTIALVASVALALSLVFPQVLLFLGAFSAALGAQIVPPLVPVMLGHRWITKQGVIAGLVVGTVAVVAFGFGPLADYGGIFGGFTALVLNLIAVVLVSLATKAGRPDREGVELVRSAGW